MQPPGEAGHQDQVPSHMLPTPTSGAPGESSGSAPPTRPCPSPTPSRPAAPAPLLSSTPVLGMAAAWQPPQQVYRQSERKSPPTAPCLLAPTTTVGLVPSAVAMLPVPLLSWNSPAHCSPRTFALGAHLSGTPCLAHTCPLSLLLVSVSPPNLAELQDFVACLPTGRGPESSLVAALLVARVLEAAPHPFSAPLPQDSGLY